jgi:hypothetical protein
MIHMAPTTPYSPQLAGREPIAAMRESAARIRSLVTGWSSADFERTYAAGKWTARQILAHLAQTELALGTRARMALVTPDYVAQPFSQDAWMANEGTLSGIEAAEAFGAISGMNVALFAGLPQSARETTFSHPEYGRISVDWIIHQMAGHQIHHLRQLEQIAGA